MADEQQQTTADTEREPARDDGYMIALYIQADGSVYVHHEPGEGYQQGEHTDSFEAALLEAVKIYRANPLGAESQAEFQSGYANEGPGVANG